jgi:hypothetical protein
VLGGRLVIARGTLQIQGQTPHRVVHVVASALEDASRLLDGLDRAGAAHPPLSPVLARADEAGSAPRGRAASPDGAKLFPSRDFQ